MAMKTKRRLRWHYLGDGAWEAGSVYHADGSGFTWRVHVLVDGSFDVSPSDAELTAPVPSFASLSDAQEWCDVREEGFTAGEGRTTVCVLWTRPQRLHAEDESLCVGVYSTREAALATAKGLAGDEWYLREHGLDTIDPGQTIWSDDCDRVGEEREKYRGFYRQYWPNGFPD
jgi:hypothetical protein